MKTLLELDSNTLMAALPAIVFFLVMLVAFGVDHYLINRRAK